VSLEVSNDILNFDSNRPDTSSISINISIPASDFDELRLFDFLKKISIYYPFDYGYVAELDEKYDFNSERKLKKGLFSISSEVTQEDIDWQINLVLTKSGYIKSFYPLNFMNSSQIRQESVKALLNEGLAKTKEFNERITVLELL